MEGMGLVILGMMFLCVVIPVSLAIGAALSFGGVPLFYWLNGVPKEKRRIGCGLKIALGFLLALVSGILITVAAVLFATHGQTWLSSAEDTFRDATDLALPPGVTIIDSENSPGFSVHLWLHFNGSARDIANILASDRFVEQANVSSDFSSFKPPAWWLPKSLGTDARYFECEDRSEEESQWRKCIFVDAQTNEVFFLRFWYY